jgi:hypothetical protein
MGQFKQPICIDFDGVISEYDGWKGEDDLGKPLKGVKEFLEKLNSVGLRWVVFTTRPHDKVADWFKKHKLPMPEDITNIKIPSPVYIDDRVIKFDGDFSKLIKDMKNFNVYWKPEKIFDEYFK